MNLTDTSVTPGESSVNNTETPQERLETALREVAFWTAILAAHTERLAAHQHAFDVANADLIQMVEDARITLAAVSRTVGDLIGSQQDEDWQDWQDDMFRERQEDARIEAQRRQDAQVSRAAADYLRGGN